MMGAKCRPKRASAPIVVKAPTATGGGDPVKFDGRSNLGAKDTKQVASPRPKGGPAQSARLT